MPATNTGRCSSGNAGGPQDLDISGIFADLSRHFTGDCPGKAQHVQTSAQLVRAAGRCITVMAVPTQVASL